MAVDPQVGQHTLDEEARLLRGQRLDEQQRVAFGLDGALPFAEVAGAAVVGGGEAEEIALHALVHQQVSDVALAEFQVEARVVELVLALAVVAAVAVAVAVGGGQEVSLAARAAWAEGARLVDAYRRGR